MQNNSKISCRRHPVQNEISSLSAIFGRHVGLPRFPVRKNIYTVRSVLIRDLYIFWKTSRFNSILNRFRIGRKTRIPSGLIVKFPLSDTTRSSLFQYGRFAHLAFTFTIIFTLTVSLTSLHSMYVYYSLRNFCSLFVMLSDFCLIQNDKFQKIFLQKGDETFKKSKFFVWQCPARSSLSVIEHPKRKRKKLNITIGYTTR